MGLGASLRVRFPHRDRSRSPASLCQAISIPSIRSARCKEPLAARGGRIYGPGIQDMKGGNFVALEAMRQIMRAGAETPLPVTFLFTPDEEIGTPPRDLDRAGGADEQYVIVPEPSFNGNFCAIGRFAIARFNLETRGVPSHAGPI